MNFDIEKLKEEIFKTSDTISTIKKLKDCIDKFPLCGKTIRKLSRDEIEILIKQGNHAENWEKIKVAENFKTDFIFNNSFYGEILLGFFSGKPVKLNSSASLPSGIYRSTLINSRIGNECLIYDNGIISNYCIMNGAAVIRVNSLSAGKNNTFGNGTEINVGIETGGRGILSFAEITLPLAEALAEAGSKSSLSELYGNFIKSYINKVTSPFGVIQPDAVITNSSKIEDSYIGNSAIIENALLVRNSTILSSSDEQTEISHGSIITDSIVQWGAEATAMAIVSSSVLSEHSCIENHGKVDQSIIGPNTGIAKGEITSSLVGPFVGFHHQAMLIAALWPGGKGNIGYGANVGSNHTSKSPDQELLCGEGVFFGLGVNIKYPSDFTDADYSIIATGVDTLPQRVKFPFSLINKPSKNIDGISPAFNEIYPAWVLSDNIYAIFRNEAKYRQRDKAKRLNIEYDIFRYEIVKKMIAAADTLESIGTIKEIYTENDIKGLGKNFMTEKSRIKAIKTYNMFIEYFALKGLLQRIKKMLNDTEKFDVKNIYSDKTDDAQWGLQKRILHKKNYHQKDIAFCLNKLIELIERTSDTTIQSKTKDDIRGEKIIKDYNRIHTKAADDPFILQFKNETGKLKNDIASVIEKIS